MTAPLRQPQAALRVADLSASTAFYQEQLGFPAEQAGPGMLLVTGPGGTPLLLAAPSADLSAWSGVPQPGPGARVYLYRTDLPALATELTSRRLHAGAPVEPYPGFRQLSLVDPDGYELLFWEPLPLSDDAILAIYRDGPRRLELALQGLTEADLGRRLGPGKWSLREIVHHLVDSDLATFHTLRLALALPGRQIQADLWEPDRWMAGLQCHERPIGPAVALWGAARAWVLEVVDHLPDALTRSVSWPSGYRATVRELLRQVGGHGLHHTLQIEAIRKSQEPPG